jgi:peptidoglycan hydrolase-like protein with peptidoglycan-binding domain
MRTAEYSALAAMSSRLIIVALMWVAWPAAAAPPADAESALSLEDRREIQQALITLGHLRGEPDGNFGSQTPAAIRQFQLFQGDAETGTLTQDERYKLLNMARHLLQLLQSAPVSPKGVTAVSLRGGPQRLLKAAGLESAGDYSEASYWYRLAANDDEAKAFTNLGTLMVRGQGVDKPDPAAAQQLWLSAAARDEPVAMFDLGTVGVEGSNPVARSNMRILKSRGKPRPAGWIRRIVDARFAMQ